MGETADHEEKNGGATKVEKKEKHEKEEKLADVGEKEGGKGEERGKDKKKKDNECKDKEGGEKEEKKKKNLEDKTTDPAKLKQKLEKMDAKMQAMAVKRDEILKMISEAEKNAANPSGAAP
ncbi:hypothetical protein RHMOL_Rhmol08G0218100 [Rhododendron molle]|uniref:Uncharacterized protein n=1 Tax=Rhododendron molle TaxID=49168 RepID=A0ACC0MR39_RHOML|nr:hypothetical protein RHMOL_Rhmol08G0218100 [Rhododendron molle]